MDNKINLIVARNSESCSAEAVIYLENYIHFSSNETSLTISNIPSHCNYTLGYVKTFGYANQTRYDEKNINICTGDSSITINLDKENK